MPAHLLQEEVSCPALAPWLPERGVAGAGRAPRGLAWMEELRSPRGQSHLLRVELPSFVGHLHCNLGTWFPNFCFLS